MVQITEAHADAMLDNADLYAETHSTCSKVTVGSVIETDRGELIFGCNHGINNCKINGCRRIKLYGDASKEHRLPSDCDAVHSEVDAISRAAQLGIKLRGATIYVTRYPCEACARAIAESGIKTVIFGRRQAMSEYGYDILDAAGVTVYRRQSWNREDTNE